MKRFDFINFSSVLLIMGALVLADTAHAMSLNEYLEQVRRESLGVKGTQQQVEASALKAREADLYFIPRLFAEARTGYDGKEQFASAITYDRLKNQNYSLGLSQEFSFGLQSKLSYVADRIEVEGANLPAGTPTSFWSATPTLELSLPLLANGFGRSSRANQDIVLEQNKVEEFSALAQNRGLLVEAEAAYWRLAAARESVTVQKRAVTQAQAILDYVTRKARMNLGENADVLQAKAMVEATSFQLQQATNAERASQRLFNTYLNRSADQVLNENLQTLDYEALQKTSAPPNRPGDRADVKAAEAQTRLAKSSSILTSERNKANLDLYGSYALNGRGEELNEALKNSGRTERDTAFVGVRLNIPLNFSAQADARAGARKAERAAEFNLEQKRFTQDQDWLQLREQIGEFSESLRLTTNMVKAQRAKLDNERARLRQGRTTTYQVLLFEQDFTQSEASRVQIAAQLLNLQAQVKLYQSSPEGEK